MFAGPACRPPAGGQGQAGTACCAVTKKNAEAERPREAGPFDYAQDFRRYDGQYKFKREGVAAWRMFSQVRLPGLPAARLPAGRDRQAQSAAADAPTKKNAKAERPREAGPFDYAQGFRRYDGQCELKREGVAARRMFSQVRLPGTACCAPTKKNAKAGRPPPASERRTLPFDFAQGYCYDGQCNYNCSLFRPMQNWLC